MSVSKGLTIRALHFEIYHDHSHTMNRLTQELQDSLKAFRDHWARILRILCRNKESEGPAWAIQKFPLLSYLHSTETDGKNGEELEHAKQFVDDIINKEIFKYVEDKYKLDENGHIGLRSADAVVQPQPPTNIQMQPPLLRPNALSMVPIPDGMVPFPTTITNTDNRTIDNRTINNINNQPVDNQTIDNRFIVNNVENHYSGADQESIEQISEKLDEILKEQKDIRKEQKDIVKKIEDLKFDHCYLTRMVDRLDNTIFDHFL